MKKRDNRDTDKQTHSYLYDGKPFKIKPNIRCIYVEIDIIPSAQNICEHIYIEIHTLSLSTSPPIFAIFPLFAQQLCCLFVMCWLRKKGENSSIDFHLTCNVNTSYACEINVHSHHQHMHTRYVMLVRDCCTTYKLLGVK